MQSDCASLVECAVHHTISHSIGAPRDSLPLIPAMGVGTETGHRAARLSCALFLIAVIGSLVHWSATDDLFKRNVKSATSTAGIIVVVAQVPLIGAMPKSALENLVGTLVGASLGVIVFFSWDRLVRDPDVHACVATHGGQLDVVMWIAGVLADCRVMSGSFCMGTCLSLHPSPIQVPLQYDVDYYLRLLSTPMVRRAPI